jgi:hypothetical protein
MKIGVGRPHQKFEGSLSVKEGSGGGILAEE